MKNGNFLVAKDVFIHTAENIMDLMKETKDDQDFQASLKLQLKNVIDKVRL